MNAFTQNFDNALDAIQFMLMSTITKLGPFTVALMPGLFTAYSVFHTFKDAAGPEFALLIAVVVALALETVGIKATHTAVDLYNAMDDKIIQPVKFWLMLALIPVYVLAVAGLVYFSGDAFTPLVKGLGVASPFLTVIVYIAVALANDLKKIEAKQASVENKQDTIEADDRQWEREKERLELEQKHAERLARIESKRQKSSVNLDNQNVNQTVQNSVKNGAFDTVNLSREEQKQRHFDSLIDIYLDNPNAGVSQVAGHLRVSRQTIYNYLDELESAGKIHRNGGGVKIL